MGRRTKSAFKISENASGLIGTVIDFNIPVHGSVYEYT
jgi:hypothetical protein